MVSGSEALGLEVCPASQDYVLNLKAEKKSISELLRLEEVIIPAFLIFFVHRYLQHGGCDCQV